MAHVNRGADPDVKVRDDDVRFQVEERRQPKKNGCSCVVCYYVLAIIILILLVFILAIALLTKGFGRWDDAVCETRGCSEAAARVSSYMDERVDPCEDFYMYSCGRYIDNNYIPPGSQVISTWDSTNDILTGRMKMLMEKKSSLDNLEVVREAKLLYKSCMDEKRIDELGVQPMKYFIKKQGGWALLDSRWSSNNFDLEKYMARFSPVGPSIISASLGFDFYNTTVSMLAFLPDALTYKDTSVYQKSDFLKSYKEYLTNLGKALGGDSDTIKRELPKMITFETELAKILGSHQAPGLPKRDQFISLVDARRRYSGFDFEEFADALLKPFNINLGSSHKIFLQHPVYTEKVIDLVKRTDKRTLAAYIMYGAVRKLVKYLDLKTRSLRDGPDTIARGRTASARSRYSVCTKVVNKVYQFTFARLYNERYFKEGAADMKEIVKSIHQTFKDRLDEQDWLDSKSKQGGVRKADSMQFKIAYPDWILDNTKLNEREKVKDLRLDRYFENMVKVLQKTGNEGLSDVMGRFDTTRWYVPTPLVVNAFYTPFQNAVMLPVGILQQPFYDKSGPKAVNYGAIGSIVGHEITHGFDNMGRSFDYLGNINEWMTSSSITQFNTKAKCIENQYSDMTIDQIGTKVDGKMTLGENIADLGAIKQAFQAYKKYVARKGSEKTLPGIKLTGEKLFFVGLSQLYCSIIKSEELKKNVKDGVHTSSKERVHGMLVNSEDFAQTFKCAAGSPMNPHEKCSLW